MTIINDIEDFGRIDVVGLQPDDRLPNDYLRMVARIFAAYREAPLESAVVAYLDGFQIHAVDNPTNNTYDFNIQAGSAFIDDQFVGFLDDMLISVPRSDFAAGRDYSVVVYYEWINITPPMRPSIEFITYNGPDSIDSQTMLEIGRFTVTAQREFIMHPQDLNGLYLQNFVKLFSNIEENILENIDAFKFQHIMIPDSAIAPETKSGDFVFFDFIDAYYKPARACTKQFDKAIGIYLKHATSGSNYLIFNGIIKFDPEKFIIDDDHNHLLNLEQGSTYYLEDGCTETDKFYLGSERQTYAAKELFPATGELGVYYIDSSADLVYVWNPNKTKVDENGNPLQDPDGNIIIGDYEVATPQPILEDRRGKITTRFFPSTVRVGFAIDHQTLSLNLDYSSELNVMNILELIGDSASLKEHYEAYRNYFDYINKIAEYQEWIGELSLESSQASDEYDAETTNKNTAETLVNTRTTNYNNKIEVYSISDDNLNENLAAALVDYSKTRIDERNWVPLFDVILGLTDEIYNTAIDAETTRENLQQIFNDMNDSSVIESPIKLAGLALITNLEAVLTNTIGTEVSINGSAFKDVFDTSSLNINSKSLKIALDEKSIESLTTVQGIITGWRSDLRPYMDFDFSNIRSINLVSDIANVAEECFFMNSPRIKIPVTVHGDLQGVTGLSDNDFYTILDLLKGLNKKYIMLYELLELLENYIKHIVLTFLSNAKMNTTAHPDMGDNVRSASDANQAYLDTYIAERIDFNNSKFSYFNLLEEAREELSLIDYKLTALYNRIKYIGDNISQINTVVEGLEIAKNGLESQDGIYARMEQQKPVTSIFHLSNLQRIQYNYTYLTIRLKLKYSTLAGVHRNIALIEQRIEDLGDQVLVDQNLLSELIRLKNSYEVVSQQLTAEIESMTSEYNRIRTENYGLSPISLGDADFDDKPIIDMNGNIIAQDATFTYANPDLACMAITE